MKTVMDVLQNCSTAVLVERHGSYLLEPLLARCPDRNVALTRIYARLEPDSMFALDSEGIATSKRQGVMLAEAQIPITEVITSPNARGAGTGLYICEGYHDLAGKWIALRCHDALNYPRYEYADTLELLRLTGDAFVAQWFNGRHAQVVVSDTPASYQGRTMGFIGDMLQAGGIRMLTTHFEAIVLAHAILVAGCELGDFDESWTPVKNGGVIIWQEKGLDPAVVKASDYDPQLELVGQPRMSSPF